VQDRRDGNGVQRETNHGPSLSWVFSKLAHHHRSRHKFTTYHPNNSPTNPTITNSNSTSFRLRQRRRRPILMWAPRPPRASRAASRPRRRDRPTRRCSGAAFRAREPLPRRGRAVLRPAGVPPPRPTTSGGWRLKKIPVSRMLAKNVGPQNVATI
jgi:hypothetical protein